MKISLLVFPKRFTVLTLKPKPVSSKFSSSSRIGISLIITLRTLSSAKANVVTWMVLSLSVLWTKQNLFEDVVRTRNKPSAFILAVILLTGMLELWTISGANFRPSSVARLIDGILCLYGILSLTNLTDLPELVLVVLRRETIEFERIYVVYFKLDAFSRSSDITTLLDGDDYGCARSSKVDGNEDFCLENLFFDFLLTGWTCSLSGGISFLLFTLYM